MRTFRFGRPSRLGDRSASNSHIHAFSLLHINTHSIMKHITQVVAVSIALVVAGCATGNPPRGTQVVGAAMAHSQVEAEIRELDQVQARAWSERDQAALERLWSPEFVLQAPSNQILTREGVFREMRTPRLSTPTQLERTTERVTPFGDIVIAMGVEHFTPKNGPSAGVAQTQRYTNVWRREGNTWRMIARHAHLLPVEQSPANPRP